MNNHADITAALSALKSAEVMFGKGGFWIRGQGFITLGEARKLTGISGPKRQRRDRVVFGGDWGMVGALHRVQQ